MQIAIRAPVGCTIFGPNWLYKFGCASVLSMFQIHFEMSCTKNVLQVFCSGPKPLCVLGQVGLESCIGSEKLNFPEPLPLLGKVRGESAAALAATTSVRRYRKHVNLQTFLVANVSIVQFCF